MVAGAAYRSGSRLVEHGHGRSAVAASAHLAGVALEDGRGGLVHDFRGRRWSAPRSCCRPARPNPSVTGRPCGTRPRRRRPAATAGSGARCWPCCRGSFATRRTSIWCATSSRESLVERGMCADFAIHAPTASDGLRQPHVAHPLLGPRGRPRRVRRQGPPVGQAGAGHVAARRSGPADCNRSLELAGREERVSHLSLEARLQDALARGEFDRRPRSTGCPACTSGRPRPRWSARASRTDLGDELRAVAEENTARAAAYEASREMAADVPEAPSAVPRDAGRERRPDQRL